MDAERELEEDVLVAEAGLGEARGIQLRGRG